MINVRRKFKNIFSNARRAGFFLVFLTLFFAVAALRAETLPIKIYTAADGLGSSYVNSVMRDSRGFLWFCTRDGLSRFDGARFVTYRVGAVNSPPGIEQIYETKNGVYWMTTTGGLYRYDPQQQRETAENQAAATSDTDRPTLNAEYISDERGTLYEDSGGNLWFVNGDTLRRLTGRQADGKFAFEKVELNLPFEATSGVIAVNQMLESRRDKSLWITTSRGLLRRLPDGRQIFYSIDETRTNPFNSILEDSAGNVWIARASEFYIIKPETSGELAARNDEPMSLRRLDDAARTISENEGGIVLPAASGEIVRFNNLDRLRGAKFLYETRDRHVWLSADNSAIEFDGSRTVWRTGEQGFIKGGQMVEDASGNLWLVSPTGVMRLDREGLTTFGAADGLKNPAIVAIGETRDGALYVGDSAFNLNRLDGGRFQTARPAAVPPDAQLIWLANPVFQDSTGEWWVLTNEKLYRFAATDDIRHLTHSQPIAAYNKKDGFKSDLMFRIFEDSRKNLWISTRVARTGFNGLARFDRASGEFYFFTEAADHLPIEKSVSAFAEDAAGNFWFGFYEGGMARFSAQENRFVVYDGAEVAAVGVVTALHRDLRGRVWITSSSGGLNRIEAFDAEKLVFQSYTTANGLTSNNARSITEDAFGNIYVGTARGVDRLAPDTGQIKHYTTNDGLAGDFVTTAFRARDGALWFGTPGGLSRLVPKSETERAAPPVWLSSLRVAGERRQISELGATAIENLELAPAQNNLQIEFFAIDFNESASLRYQYKLEGADEDWLPPTDQRTVNYANLSAGDYRFLVRSVSADGTTSQNPSIVSFVILRPVWQRWWFLLGLSSLIGLAVYAIYRYRLAQLVQIERVRTRIATDLHDDIGASLSQIAILSEVARQKVGAGGASEPLQKIAGTSREMVDSMADIVWAINPERDRLSDLTGRMRSLASEMTELGDIGLKFIQIDSDGNDWHLSADLRREIYLIFKETLNNLVKHSGCERVEIEFRLDADDFVFTVSDDGRGFDTDAVESPATRGGNGLLNMRKRAVNLGGSYRVESKPGAGTISVLRVPLKQKFSLLNFLSR